MRSDIFPTREYHKDGTVPGLDRVLVFGSNLQGRHGNGAALLAAKFFNADEGVGQGRTGQAYAIATRKRTSDTNAWIVTRDFADVAIDVAAFVEYTYQNTDLEYFVTAVGCGKAGFMDALMAPLFRAAMNCSFPQQWKPYLEQADHELFENNKKSM